ncbi:MAG: DUF4102 domain-containing protein [Rhodoferax sp.]|nr:DUF4102 domain-containing protein [Rhodoferax sp.]
MDAHKPTTGPYKLALDRGLQLRIAPDSGRTLLVRYTVKGKTAGLQYRLSRESGKGWGQIRLAAGCAEATRIRALARDGIDWPAQEANRLRAEAEAREVKDGDDGLTLAMAVRQCVDARRRAKDG